MAFCLERTTELELRGIPGNNLCVDCAARSPQWASVSFGIFMCLECSGQHRSLGVHISFVRSVTMDSWTADQIKLMRMSGNEKFNNFLAQYDALAKQGGRTNINNKYNSPAASLYKDRLEAELAGRPLPTQLPAARSSGGSGGVSGSVEPINGESEEAYVRRQARQKEEAQERLRQKFGKSTGLGGVGSAMQGIGSDPNYRPGMSGESEGFSLSLDSLGFSEQSANKLKSDAAKAAADTWSWMGSSLSLLGETVSTVAANVVETVDPKSSGNRGNSGIGSNNQQRGSSQEEDDTLSQNWNYLKSGAWDLYSKAAQASSEVVKTIAEIQGGDDDEPLFPTKNLKAYSTGKMSHQQGESAKTDNSGDIFSFRSNLQTASTGKMVGIGSGSVQAPGNASIQRSPRGDSGSDLIGAAQGMQRADSGSSGERSASGGSTPSFGASRSSSSNSMEGQANKEKAPGSQGSQGSPRVPKESVAKKITPPPSDDDFFGSFGVDK